MYPSYTSIYHAIPSYDGISRYMSGYQGVRIPDEYHYLLISYMISYSARFQMRLPESQARPGPGPPGRGPAGSRPGPANLRALPDSAALRAQPEGLTEAPAAGSCWGRAPPRPGPRGCGRLRVGGGDPPEPGPRRPTVPQ